LRAFRLAGQLRQRLVLDAVVVALGVAPYMIAWTSDRLAEAGRPAGRHASHPPIAK